MRGLWCCLVTLEMMTSSDTTEEQVMLMADNHVFCILIAPHGAVIKEMPEEATGTALAARTQCKCRDFLFGFFQVVLDVANDQMENSAQKRAFWKLLLHIIFLNKAMSCCGTSKHLSYVSINTENSPNQPLRLLVLKMVCQQTCF